MSDERERKQERIDVLKRDPAADWMRTQTLVPWAGFPHPSPCIPLFISWIPHQGKVLDGNWVKWWGTGENWVSSAWHMCVSVSRRVCVKCGITHPSQIEAKHECNKKKEIEIHRNHIWFNTYKIFKNETFTHNNIMLSNVSKLRF